MHLLHMDWTSEGSPRGYAHVTVKEFLDHLRQDVAKLTTRKEDAMKDGIILTWDRPEHIRNFWQHMGTARSRAERWQEWRLRTRRR